MYKHPKDLTGLKYGKLTVMSKLENGYLKCRCDCGGIKVVKRNRLVMLLTQSCGCKTKGSKTKRKKNSNNTSSFRGVHFTTLIRRNYKSTYAISKVWDSTGKLHKKAFNVDKYGVMEATALACQFRETQIQDNKC